MSASAPRLRLVPIAVALLAISALEPLLLARDPAFASTGSGVPAVLASGAAAILCLFLIERAPLPGLAVVAVLVPLRRELGLAPVFSVSSALLVSVAAFAGAAFLPARRWTVAALAGLTAGHAALIGLVADKDQVAPCLAAARFGAAALAGAALAAASARLIAARTARREAEAALAAGPSDAVARERLRVWRSVHPRLAAVLHDLVAQVGAVRTQAGTAPRDALDALQRVRIGAVEALDQMRATVHLLHLPPDGSSAAAAAPPAGPHARGPSAGAALAGGLFVLSTCALLEQALLDVPGPPGAGVAASVLLPATVALAWSRPALGTAAFATILLAGTALEVVGGATTTQNYVGMATCVVVALRAPSPVSATAGFAAIAGAAVTGLVIEPFAYSLGGYVTFVLSFTLAFGIGLLLRDTVAEARTAGDESHALARARTELDRRTVEQHRARLAAELHDVVGHALTAVTMQAGAASARLQHGRTIDGPALDGLERAAAMADAEIHRLGRLLTGDPSPAPAPGDLAAALRAHTEALGVALELDGDIAALGPPCAEAVVRIVGEALTNAAKYADGADAIVRVTAGDEDVEVVVRNGPGRPTGLGGTGRGLAYMRARAESCGGVLEVQPEPDGGWSVVARLPPVHAGRTSPVS